MSHDQAWGTALVVAAILLAAVLYATEAIRTRRQPPTPEPDPEPVVTYDDFLDRTTAHEIRNVDLEWSLETPWNQPGGNQQR